jgi:phosphoglycerate dehydrogenase-like enzyme
LTQETATLLDAVAFCADEAGVAFVNIGRSACDYVALADALKSGVSPASPTSTIRAAAATPLWGIGNLIMMPHVTSDDEDQYLRKTFDMVFENVRRIAAGKPLLNVVDRNRGY